MQELRDALTKLNQTADEMSDNIKAIRRYIAKPTELDFLSVCQSINNLLGQVPLPPLSESELRLWGIDGGESLSEIKDMVDKYIQSLENKE